MKQLGPTEFSESHNLTPAIVGTAAPSAAGLGKLLGTTGSLLYLLAGILHDTLSFRQYPQEPVTSSLRETDQGKT